MANVKVFDGQTNKKMDRQTDRQTDRVITIGHPPRGGGTSPVLFPVFSCTCKCLTKVASILCPEDFKVDEAWR